MPNANQPKKLNRNLAFISGGLALLFLVVTIFSFAFPMMRKSSAINKATSSTVTTMEVIAKSFTAFSTNNLDSFSANPSAYPQYFQTYSLGLATASDFFDFSRMVVATNYKDNPTVMADSSYTVGGDQYLSLGSTLPNDWYKGNVAIFAALYDQSETYQYSTTDLDASVLSIYVPMYNSDDEIYGVLICDYILENSAFNMIGTLNLTYLGIGTLLITLLCGGLAFLFFKKGILQGEIPFKPLNNKLLREPVPAQEDETVSEPATLFNQQGDDLPVEPVLPPTTMEATPEEVVAEEVSDLNQPEEPQPDPLEQPTTEETSEKQL